MVLRFINAASMVHDCSSKFLASARSSLAPTVRSSIWRAKRGVGRDPRKLSLSRSDDRVKLPRKTTMNVTARPLREECNG
jgi:hypothetical protein